MSPTISFFIMSLACAKPVLLDRTGLGLVDQESHDAISRAIHTCRVRYRGCLISITRTEEHSYQAICGRRI